MNKTVPVSLLTTANILPQRKDDLFESLDPDNLSSINEIRLALEKIQLEEKKVEERLEWSVSNRHHLEAKLAQLSKLVPTLQLVHSDACQLKNKISFTEQLANTVSARVRHLDTAKKGVVAVQCRVGDLLDLEGCAGGVATALQQEDYETAAAHIHRFLAMDEKLLVNSADSTNRGGQSIEMWFERLRSAEQELGSLIEKRFDEAVRNQDSASVDRFFKLFPLLNRKQQGLMKFSTFLCASIQETGDMCLKKCLNAHPQNKRAHLVWADAATELFETVARIVEVRQPIVETYYGPGQLVLVVTELVGETDRQAGRLIQELRTHRKLDTLTMDVGKALNFDVTSVNSSSNTLSNNSLPDPRTLDMLLGELTLLNARADLFLRFMRRRVALDLESFVVDKNDLTKQVTDLEQKLWRSQVACDMAAVIGQYTILEQYYLNQSFAKALSMDTQPPGTVDGAPMVDRTSVSKDGDIMIQVQISSIVDDAFYIIKKSVRRAISSSSVDGVCAVLNHAVNLIETQLATGFQQTLRKGYPAHGYMDISQAYTAFQTSLQTGKIHSSTNDTDAFRQTFLTSLNSAETSKGHVVSLEKGLQDAIAATMTSLTVNSKEKIQSCLGDLRGSGNKLQQVVDFGISQLRATAIKPRVKSWVHGFTTTNHDITEEEFACYEANDPFSESLIMNVDSTLGSYRPLLTPTNHNQLTSVMVQEVANHLEMAMFKSTYNRFGGLLVDREIRAIVGYLSTVAQWSVREQLSRITQIATLLNLDNLAEVEEYSNSASWRLSTAEMRKALQLRVDFKFDDIRRLKL